MSFSLSDIEWAAWVLFFIIFEGKALLEHKTQDTFSWKVWSFQKLLPPIKFMIAGGIVWLGIHFFTG